MVLHFPGEARNVRSTQRERKSMRGFANYKESQERTDDAWVHQKKMYVLTQKVLEEMVEYIKEAGEEKEKSLKVLLEEQESHDAFATFVLLHMKIASDFMMGWKESLQEHEHEVLLLVQKHPYLSIGRRFLEEYLTIEGADASLSEKEIEAWEQYCKKWFALVACYEKRHFGGQAG